MVSLKDKPRGEKTGEQMANIEGLDEISSPASLPCQGLGASSTPAVPPCVTVKPSATVRVSTGTASLHPWLWGPGCQLPGTPSTPHPHTRSQGGQQTPTLPTGCGPAGCTELQGPGWHLPVEEDAADIVVCDGRLLGAGCHAQWPQEVVDEDVELLDILGLSLQHAENNLVPLAHAVGMRGPYVVLDDGLPLPPAQPAPQEALHLPGAMAASGTAVGPVPMLGTVPGHGTARAPWLLLGVRWCPILGLLRTPPAGNEQ